MRSKKVIIEEEIDIIILSSDEEDEDKENIPIKKIAEGDIIHVNNSPIKIEQNFAEGVFGKVFFITTAKGRKMALKVQKFVEQKDKDYVLKEVNILKRIKANGGEKHHLVAYYGDLTRGDEHLLFFELMGDSLEDYLEDEKPKSLKQTLTIGKNLLSAVAFLHSIGIVHTDIKPTNILLPRKDTQTVKLCDFGNAVYQENLFLKRGRSLTALVFRPPEVYLCMELNEKLDIWAVGCLLAEVYTGHQIFPANSHHQLAKFHFELVGVPCNWKDGWNWENFMTFDRKKRKARCFTESELQRQGIPLEADERQIPITKLDEIVFFGLNSSSQSIEEKDHQFANLMKRLLCPSNKERTSAKDALNHNFFTTL